MPKKTPAQHFRDLFTRFTAGSNEHERAEGEKAMDAWLKRNNKARIDIQSILVQAAADDAARAPPPPPSDPRDAQKHPYADPQFTPAGLVLGVTKKYLTMTPHVATIYSLWICFTHVYPQFRIAPRVALVSEGVRCGKSEALDVAKCLVLRPNPEVLSTPAAIADFIDEGPCTIGLDELDLVDPDVRRTLQLLWNVGYKRGAKRSLMVKGRRKSVNLHAPMMAAGIGSFLATSQLDRTFVLEMHRYTEETKPELKFNDEHTGDLDIVYAYLRQWALKVKFDFEKLKELMPPGVRDRDEDNAWGLLAVAHACGTEWVQRLREALMFFLEKAKSERPEIVLIRHGLVIFDMLEITAIRSTRFHQELKRLDLPDARWMRYRGPSGTDTMHPITPGERVTLAEMVGIAVKKCKLPNEKQFRGYTLAQFEEAHRIHCAPGAGPGAPRLRLITPTSE
jgi:hypothetical protein